MSARGMVRLSCPECTWVSSWRPRPEVGPAAPGDLLNSYCDHYAMKHRPRPIVIVGGSEPVHIDGEAGG